MALFKTKRRPDAVSASMNLDQHIANTTADPHPQYLLKSDISDEFHIDISSLLQFVSNRDIPAGDEHTAVDAYVIQLIDADVLKNKQDIISVSANVATLNTIVTGINTTVTNLVTTVDEIEITIDGLRSDLTTLSNKHDTLSSNFYDLQSIFNSFTTNVGSFTNFGSGTLVDRFLTHTQAYPQSVALDEDSVASPHVDTDGLSLFAARTHTHTPAELHVSPDDHDHDNEYSDIGHNHDTRYPTRTELTDTGIYPNAVKVTVLGESVDDPETPEIEEYDNSVDCNDYLTQGSYYFEEAGILLVNGPHGVLGGLLNVFSTEQGNYPVRTTQILYSEDASWKRHGVTEQVTSTTTDEETGEEVTTTTVETTFTDWLPLNETAPIVSWMFNNQATNVPRGYLEANGAEVSNTSYPLLWKFIIDNGALVTNTNWQTNMGGSYGLSAEHDNLIGRKILTSADINQVYVEDQYKHFVLLTEYNISLFESKNVTYIDRVILETIDSENPIRFHLPNVGGNFLKMWTAGSVDGSVGSFEEAGLPNIVGTAWRDGSGFGRSTESQYTTYQLKTTGAFYDTMTGIPALNGIMAGVNGAHGAALGIDASRSSEVYGNSDTVTPKNNAVRVFIKAYNGSLVPPDTTQSAIEAIIRDLIGVYEYATYATPGIVRLATNDIANGVTADNIQPSVVTAAQLIAKDSTNVKSVEIGNTEYIPSGNKLVLPGFAPMEGNRVVILSMGTDEHITCTAISDEKFHDFVVSEEVALNIEDISYVSTSVLLKCIDEAGANNLGYPNSATIVDPMCASKSVSQYEYLSKPQIVVFEDSTTYADNGGTSTRNRIVVRMYWPLMWYMRKFEPVEGKESAIYPLTSISGTEAELLTAIEAECAYWTVQVKLSL